MLAGGDAGAALAQGGLLDALKKALTERALNAEMDHHLAGEEGAGNSRNGYGRKTITTDTGKLAIDVPRDRQASFDPQLIAKYQRRFPGYRSTGAEEEQQWRTPSSRFGTTSETAGTVSFRIGF